jgi:hypothetical protein
VREAPGIRRRRVCAAQFALSTTRETMDALAAAAVADAAAIGAALVAARADPGGVAALAAALGPALAGSDDAARAGATRVLALVRGGQKGGWAGGSRKRAPALGRPPPPRSAAGRRG